MKEVFSSIIMGVNEDLVWGNMFNKIKNSLLDKSIYYSFDMSGFERHKKADAQFQEDLGSKSCRGLYGLITGGSTELGRYCADFLADRNTKVLLCGDSVGKSFTNKKIEQHILNLSKWDKLKSFAQRMPKLDFLVLNVGELNKEYSENIYGYEKQFSSQLIGQYLLLKELMALGRLSSRARIVWVTSGGLYLKKLDQSVFREHKGFNHLNTYTNCKRAQVLLVQELAKSAEFSGLQMNCMHPGWMDTPGVEEAIPNFYKKAKDRMRTAAAGADTILWLLLSNSDKGSGGLYFDRKKQKKHIVKWTKESDSERESFMLLIQKIKSEFDRRQSL